MRKERREGEREVGRERDRQTDRQRETVRWLVKCSTLAKHFISTETTLNGQKLALHFEKDSHYNYTHIHTYIHTYIHTHRGTHVHIRNTTLDWEML